MSRVRRQVREWLPALVVFVLGIALWEGGVRLFDVENFLLPAPSDIAQTLWEDRSQLWSATFFTFREALGGFLIGCSAGFLVALFVARFRMLEAAVMPYAIAAGAIPIIAFAPITNNWFGVTGMSSKIAIAAVLCFFPMMVNTTRGLRSVRASSIELMRSYAARDLTIFWRVRLPSALPFVFSGLKVATVLAMIGAIVGDYFGGAPGALGVEIRRWVGIFAFDQAWAGIVLASALGIVFYGSVALVERMTMGWHPSVRGARPE
ncbi:MAG TPA: ABC transporter permease [Gaiellaceae bacterium]|nr:ABC transporter permease [Gaiellaceae bacterium]